MFDDQLANNRFLAGDRFSVADITLVVALDFAKQVKVVTLPELENIGRWYAELSERASISAS
jgi:glutathione S-transferase